MPLNLLPKPVHLPQSPQVRPPSPLPNPLLNLLPHPLLLYPPLRLLRPLPSLPMRSMRGYRRSRKSRRQQQIGRRQREARLSL
jgi:hypothetical protein